MAQTLQPCWFWLSSSLSPPCRWDFAHAIYSAVSLAPGCGCSWQDPHPPSEPPSHPSPTGPQEKKEDFGVEAAARGLSLGGQQEVWLCGGLVGVPP